MGETTASEKGGEENDPFTVLDHLAVSWVRTLAVEDGERLSSIREAEETISNGRASAARARNPRSAAAGSPFCSGGGTETTFHGTGGDPDRWTTRAHDDHGSAPTSG